MKGRFQIYTGSGKGKTTAALGLTLRAAGAGLRTYLGQFLKRRRTGEVRMLGERFPEVTVEQYGRSGFVSEKPSPADVEAARRGLRKLRRALLGGNYDVVIADELTVAIRLGLVREEDAMDLIAQRPAGVELVLTGRGAGRRIIRQADLVTDMRKVKHYFDRGTKARRGIEF